jgi:hypothetical protein
MATRRLSESGRAELEARREHLQLELRLIEGELRTDKALRLQEACRPADVRPRLRGGWRGWVERWRRNLPRWATLCRRVCRRLPNPA